MSDNSSDAAAFFCKHLVSLHMSFKWNEGGRIESHSFSGFVLSYHDIWLYVTAGHVLKRLDIALSKGLVSIEECFLIDAFGPEVKSLAPVTFDYSTAVAYYQDDDTTGLDFGLIALLPFYRRQLEVNRIVAVDEQGWREPSGSAVTTHLMIGLPAILNQKQVTSGRTAVLIPVENVGIDSHKPFARLTGRIPEKCPLDDIDGMSGGPIVGLKNGRYWICAVQSSWNRYTRVIHACPINVIISLVDRLILEDTK